MSIDLHSIKNIIKQGLELHDMEPTGEIKSLSDCEVQVNVNKLFQVSVENNKPVYVKVPKTIKIILGEANQIKSIEDEKLSQDEQASAVSYFNSIRENGGIKGITNGSSQTHQIVENEKGQQIITRYRIY